jgi:hypothetical protein
MNNDPYRPSPQPDQPPGNYPPSAPQSFPANGYPSSAPYPPSSQPAWDATPTQGPYPSAPAWGQPPVYPPTPPQARPVGPLLVGVGSVVALLVIGIIIFTSVTLHTVSSQRQATAVALNATMQSEAHATATEHAFVAQATAQAQATASAIVQATAVTQSSASYFDAIPGCDGGNGKWGTNQVGKFQCLPHALQITNDPKQQYISTMYFGGYNGGIFPANYHVSVDVTITSLTYGCAGIDIREHDNYGTFAFYICPRDQAWFLLSYDGATGKPQQVASGVFFPKPSQETFTLRAVANGNTQTYYVGVEECTTQTFSGFTYLPGIGLDLSVDNAYTSSAIFSNFALTNL